MSFKAIEWVYTVRGLHPVERVVLAYLARRANGKNQCWPSMKKITDDCEIGRTSAYRAIDRLRELGLLEVQARVSDSGRNRSSMFTLKLHRLGKSQGGTEKSHGGTPESHGGTPVPESSSESSSESQKQPMPAALLSDQTMEIEVKAEDLLMEITKKQTAEQVIAKAKVKGQPTSYRLSHLWKDLHAVHKVGGFLVPPSHKEQGQFTHLAKLLGSGSDVCLVMSAVVRDWMGFGKFLKEQGVVHDFPDRPHIGFLLKHGQLADQFRLAAKPVGHVPLVSSGPKPYTLSD